MLPVAPTPYDVNFSVFRIPVRIHPLFWLIAAFISWVPGRLDLVVIGIFCVFLSILVHELGHAFSARHFGWPPGIVLHGMGGMAFYQPTSGYTRGRAIWIALAGPLAGFALFAVVFAIRIGCTAALAAGDEWAVRMFAGRTLTPVEYAIGTLLWINLFWGILNLMPVLPLDGGRICMELFNARHSTAGQRRTSIVGMVTATLLAAYFLSNHMFLGGLLFASLAYDSYRQYEQLRRGRW